MLAALLHACWNALVKNGGDKVVSMTAVIAGHLLPGLVGIAIFPLPGWQAWPWILASVVFHTGYQLFLMRAYRLGDFAQVYPIARGTGPALVALVSSLFLGLALSGQQWLAIFLVCLGVVGLGLVRQADGLRNGHAVVAALSTGIFIAGYSLADGLGARASENGIGFILWASVINSLMFIISSFFWRPTLIREIRETAQPAFWIGGTGSVVAYSLAVWAMTQAPIAVVTALRETSVLFGLALAALFFGEKVGIGRITAGLTIVGGVILLRLAA
jgi:drug/metabolite transporter (DMT)-like permease